MLRKAALACAGAIVLFSGLAAGAAASDTMTIRPSGRFSASSVGAVTYSDPAGSLSVRCNVTLTGTFASSTAMYPDTTFGGVTSATASGCTGGTVTFPGVSAERPWPIAFNDVVGTLPSSVTGLQLELESAAVSIAAPLATCQYRGDLQLELATTGTTEYSGDTITSLANQIPLSSGGFFCPRTGVMRGTTRLATRGIIVPSFGARAAVTAPQGVGRFGTVRAGRSSTRTITFTNGEREEYDVGFPVLAGAEAGFFAVEFEALECWSATLDEQDTCTVRVTFNSAGAVGDVKAAQLDLSHTAVDGEPTAVSHVTLWGKVG